MSEVPLFPVPLQRGMYRARNLCIEWGTPVLDEVPLY